MGFLNEQSLTMIVDAQRDVYNEQSFSFPPEMPHLAMSMPFTQSGPLRKLIIAATFDVSMPVGWPELQIIRNASNGTAYINTIAFATSTSNVTAEPKPTKYLNVYEYNLTTTNFTIQSGDILNISWLVGNRFSLAYYNNGTSPAIPMVSVVVGDCEPETDFLTLDSLYCELEKVTATPTGTINYFTTTPMTEFNGSVTTTNIMADTGDETSITSTATTHTTEESINTTQTSTDDTSINNIMPESEAKVNETTIISGVVGSSLLLLIILLIFLVVLTFVVKQRRKSASLNAIDSTEMTNQPRMLHNTPSKSTCFDNSNFYRYYTFSRE